MTASTAEGNVPLSYSDSSRDAQLFDAGRPIAIIGCGVIGTRVAWACAHAGIITHLFDESPRRAEVARGEALGFGIDRPELLVPKASLDEALDGVQLAFENVPEQLALKRELLNRIGASLMPTAYIGSNTSSIPCAPLAESSGRPSNFFNMNFSDPRHSRLVELMGCDATSPATLQFATQWAEALGLIALLVAQDQLGYAHNRLWRVIKKEVLRQIACGASTPQDIDRAWMLSYGKAIGPCGVMDSVGLGTVLAIEEMYFSASGDPSDRPPDFLRQMVLAGDIGVRSGRGFYSYPGPEFEDADFIRSTLQTGARASAGASRDQPTNQSRSR